MTYGARHDRARPRATAALAVFGVLFVVAMGMGYSSNPSANELANPLYLAAVIAGVVLGGAALAARLAQGKPAGR